MNGIHTAGIKNKAGHSILLRKENGWIGKVTVMLSLKADIIEMPGYFNAIEITFMQALIFAGHLNPGTGSSAYIANITGMNIGRGFLVFS